MWYNTPNQTSVLHCYIYAELLLYFILARPICVVLYTFMNFVHSCVWQLFLKNKRWDESHFRVQQNSQNVSAGPTVTAVVTTRPGGIRRSWFLHAPVTERHFWQATYPAELSAESRTDGHVQLKPVQIGTKLSWQTRFPQATTVKIHRHWPYFIK